MSIIIADRTGFRGSLDLANFAAGFANQDYQRDKPEFGSPGFLYQAPLSRSPNFSADLVYFGFGYSAAPLDGSKLPVGTSFAFNGNGGVVGYSNPNSDEFYGFELRDAFFKDTIVVGSTASDVGDVYRPEKGALQDLQDAINAAPITFFGSDEGSDVVRVAGGALAFDDTLYGRGGDDFLEGGDGNDSLFGEVGNDILDGGAGNDRLYGGNETDQLFGGAGDDLLDGGIGGDRMTGGIGDDTYVVDNIYDAVLELSGQGTDTAFSSISYILPGAVENITLTGSQAINATGNGLKNILTGNSASNTLDGGAYDDVLNGKGGADILIGGTGFDTFVFEKGEANDDVIQDFTGYGKAFGDRIVFQGYDEGAFLQKVGGDLYQIVDGADVETITIRGVVDQSDYQFLV